MSTVALHQQYNSSEHPDRASQSGLHKTEGLQVGLSGTWLVDNLHADSLQREACHPIRIDVQS